MVNGEPRHCGDGGEWTSTNLEQSRPMLAPPSLAESEILVVNWEWINLVVKLVVAIFLWILNLMALIFWWRSFWPIPWGPQSSIFSGPNLEIVVKKCARPTTSLGALFGWIPVGDWVLAFSVIYPPTIKSWEHDHHWILYHFFSKPALNFSPSKLRCFSVKTADENPHDQVGDLPDLRVVRRVKEILCVSRTLWMWILYICYANTYTHYSNSHNIYIYSYMVFIYNYSYMVFI